MMDPVSRGVKEASESPAQPQTYSDCIAEAEESERAALSYRGVAASGAILSTALRVGAAGANVVGANDSADNAEASARMALGVRGIALDARAVERENARQQRAECESLR
jgi:hypothetical protein